MSQEKKNAYYGVPGIWKGDGTPDATLQVVPDNHDSSILQVASAKRGTPFNCYWDLHDWTAATAATATMDAYFEVTLEQLESRSASISIGLVAPQSDLKPGWKTRGLFYNGNLTNGSAALQTSFGPHLAAGDTVGVRMRMHPPCDTTPPQQSADHAQLTVVFYHNQRCLGPGFVLEKSQLSAGSSFPSYPCLHVDGKNVRVRFHIPATLPSGILTREPAPPLDDFCGGQWKLVQAVDSAQKIVPLPSNQKILLHMIPSGNNGSGSEHTASYAVSIHVANHLRTSLTLHDAKREKDATTTMPRQKAVANVGAVMSTRMLPPPALQVVEQFFHAILSGLQAIVVDNGDADNNERRQMVWESIDAKAVFEYHEDTGKEPCTSY